MAATITGIVFNDLNRNGLHDTGPGIASVFVVLSGASGCMTAQTDANGNYSFSAVAGTYTIYEPVSSPNACPPTVFSQPTGFTVSNGPRKRTVTVTAAQSNNGATIAGLDFSHAADSDSLTCNANMIQFVGIPTVWYNIDLVTGASVAQGPLTPAHYVNAIGFDPLDNFLYGYDQTNNTIARIDADGMITTMQPNPPGLPVADYTTGGFDGNGFFYLYAVNTARFYTVDLRPGSATFMKLVNPANGYAEQTSNFGTALSAAIDVSDWAISPADGNLYGVNRSGNVVRVVPTTGAVSVLTTTGPKEAADTSYGANGFDFNGNMYAIANSSGVIRKYTITGNTANGALFSQSAASSNNDGAMCFFATVDVDYGDAPDTDSGNGPDNYNTLLQNNGPRHALINTLYLGTRVTAETNAYENADATGDDISKGIQDDGLTVPLAPLSPLGGSYVLNVTITNQTGQTAHLYGWIDYNQNGLFESGEAAAVATVPSLAGTQVIPLTFDVPSGVLTPGHSFVRLRLTTDTLTDAGGVQDTRSVGAAGDGEVEDYIVEVSGEADISVVKVGSPKPVTAGETLTYTITITNAGPSVAINTTLTDALPSDILNPEFSTDGGVTWLPWNGSYTVGDLPAGGVQIILLRGTVSPSATGTIVNTAVVSSDTPDPNPDNNTSTDATDVVAGADLAVTKIGAPSPVMTGELLTYTVTVRNLGPSDAQSAVITDALPAQLLNAEYSTDGGTTWLPWNGSVNAGTIPACATVIYLIRGTVAPGATGIITNTVRVDSPTPDPDPDNNSDTADVPVEVSADLSITKRANTDTAVPGQLLTYTITVTNAGPSDAESVVLIDALPPVLLTPEYSLDGGATWQAWPGMLMLGSIAAGDGRSILLRGTVDPTATGNVVNTAVVTSDTPDPDPDNNTDTDVTPVEPLADMSVIKTADPDPVAVGFPVTYTLTVQNFGPAAAENVVLTDILPAGTTDPQYSLDGGASYAPWTGALSLNTVPSSTTKIILLRATVTTAAAPTLSNTATVTSDTPDPNSDNNTSTADTTVVQSADLSVTKTASPDPVRPGELLTYTITVANAGPGTAVNAVLADSPPAGLTNVEVSLDGGVSWQPWSNPLALGNLASGTAVTVLLRGTVAADAVGRLRNTATVTSDTPDPNPDDNTAVAETCVCPGAEPVGSADLSVVKTPAVGPVLPGGQIFFNVVVHNNGPDAAENVVLFDNIPPSVLNPEYSLDGGLHWQPWTNPLLLGALAAGETVNILLHGQLASDATGAVINTAVVTSDTPDPNPLNNTSDATVPVAPTADLGLTKTAFQNCVCACDTLNFLLTVTNFGPSAAENVLLTDNCPDELCDMQVSLDNGANWTCWTGAISLATIPPHTTVSVLLRGTVNECTGGSIVNTARVSSSTPDLNPDNDVASVTVRICSCCDW